MLGEDRSGREGEQLDATELVQAGFNEARTEGSSGKGEKCVSLGSVFWRQPTACSERSRVGWERDGASRMCSA